MDSVHADRVLLCRVSPFGHPRIKAHLRLPVAFRSLSRPSSALSAKAFPLRPLQLDQLLSGYLSISRIIRVISVLLAICSTIFRSYPNNFQKNLKLIYIKIGITFYFLYCCFCFRYCSVFKVQNFFAFSEILRRCVGLYQKDRPRCQHQEVPSRCCSLWYFAFTKVVGLRGLEPPTSRLSGVRSNHLSYKPI